MIEEARPLISLLLVAAVGWMMFGSEIVEQTSSFISEAVETLLPQIFLLPLLLLLMVLFMNEIAVIPLALMLGVFSLRIGPLGPILLLLVISFLGSFSHSPSSFVVRRSI